MQDAITVTVTLAGLFFSLCCALLLEELLCGGLFQVFFRSVAPAKVHSKSARPEWKR